MSVTLGDIATLVNLELGNTEDRGTAKATGTAGTSKYLIAPPFRSILNDADFAFYVDSVADTSGVMDFDNGVYSCSEDYAGHSLQWEFNYVYWVRAQVYAAINAGIGMCFPFFYRTVREDVTTDGTADEFTLTTSGVEELRKYTISTDGGVTFTGNKRGSVELDYDDPDTIVKFFTAPGAGTVRLSLICRGSEMVEAEDILDLPDRAISPIVSYACYHLLNQKQAPRLRADVAVATVGGGNLSPRQMNDASNSFLLRYQAQCQQLKMRPWRVS